MAIIKNLSIYLGLTIMVALAFGIIVNDYKIPQKNIELNIKIDDIVNTCKKQDDDKLIISF